MVRPAGLEPAKANDYVFAPSLDPTGFGGMPYSTHSRIVIFIIYLSASAVNPNKYVMNRKEAIAVVEELLDLYTNKELDTVKDVMLYQRGFLTGILADLIRDDFYAASKIQRKINKRKPKH